MKKEDINEYMSPEERARDKIVAIVDYLSPTEWEVIPDLCKAFFEEFQTGLLLQPMKGLTTLTVWFSFYEELPYGVSLDDAADFVTNYLEVNGRLTPEGLVK